MREEALEKQREAEAEKKMQENEKFWVELEKSEDPFDCLEGLAQYIHDNIGTTGVYIGQLEAPFLGIKEDADNAAHLDLANPQIIKFKFANSTHKELIQNTTLKPTQGISHEVFSEQITEDNQLIDLEQRQEPINEQFKHLYVKEVVREPRMHYWTVPRLGSYMAIPLVYKSCLSIESFDQSIKDFHSYK